MVIQQVPCGCVATQLVPFYENLNTTSSPSRLVLASGSDATWASAERDARHTNPIAVHHFPVQTPVLTCFMCMIFNILNYHYTHLDLTKQKDQGDVPCSPCSSQTLLKRPACEGRLALISQGGASLPGTILQLMRLLFGTRRVFSFFTFIFQYSIFQYISIHFI